MAQTLEDFLVKLGFDVDANSFKKFGEILESAEKDIGELGIATAAAAVIIDESITKVAEKFESLYYTSVRTGASVKNIQALQYGAEQVGVSADQATGSLEAMARAVRMNPGMNGLLNKLGVQTQGRDMVDQQRDLVRRLSQMPHYQGARIGEMFGISEDQLLLYQKFGDQMDKAEERRKRMIQQAGLDPDKMASQSRDFMNGIRDLEAALSVVEALLAERFMPGVKLLIRGLDEVVQLIGRADKLTGGASTVAIGTGGVVAALMGAKGLGPLIGRWLGVAGKAGPGAAIGAGESAVATTAAEAGVATAAGEAGVGVASAAVLLPVIIAVLGALGIAWLLKTSGAADRLEQIGEEHSVRKTAQAVADYVAPKAEAVKKQADAEVDALYKIPAKLRGWYADNLEGDAFTKKHEGRRTSIYGDIAGIGTYGYGHVVKPGEKMLGVDPDALFQKDMGRFKSEVNRLTAGLGLNKHQLNALYDFDFSTGSLGKKNNTLMAKLRAGDMPGAAHEFERWDVIHKNGKPIHSPALMARRLGEESMFNRTDNAGDVHISQETNIHVASTNPQEAGNQVARQQKAVNGDLVRNAGVNQR